MARTCASIVAASCRAIGAAPTSIAAAAAAGSPDTALCTASRSAAAHNACTPLRCDLATVTAAAAAIATSATTVAAAVAAVVAAARWTASDVVRDTTVFAADIAAAAASAAAAVAHAPTPPRTRTSGCKCGGPMLDRRAADPVLLLSSISASLPLRLHLSLRLRPVPWYPRRSFFDGNKSGWGHRVIDHVRDRPTVVHPSVQPPMFALRETATPSGHPLCPYSYTES